MNEQQKRNVQFGIDFATRKIQEIEAGNDDLQEKWRAMEQQLLLMLDDVVEALPKASRVQAQACIEACNRVWKALLAEINATIEAHRKEASPVCLQAQDSL